MGLYTVIPSALFGRIPLIQPNCSDFRIITAIFWGPSFWIFMVGSGNCCLNSSIRYHTKICLSFFYGSWLLLLLVDNCNGP